jgi:hypothetical protein
VPRWTDDDNAKLRSLAGTVPSREVAAHLGRSVAAPMVQASKLKLPLGVRRSTDRSAPQILSRRVQTLGIKPPPWRAKDE